MNNSGKKKQKEVVSTLEQPVQFSIDFIDNHSQIFGIVHKVDVVHVDNQ